MPDSATPTVQIVIGVASKDLERFAASELQRYLESLYGIIAPIETEPADGVGVYFFVGTAASNPLFAQSTRVPSLSDQGFLLRRVIYRRQPCMLVMGGSAQSALWAVYEMVERFGVRYLLHGDVFPDSRAKFVVPLIDRVWEPRLPVRCWRTINDFAAGSEPWGMSDYRLLLDQLAKLKFNRIRLAIWAWQPYVHLEVRGVARKSAHLWFNYHYPITDDMPGRELFDNRAEFWHPDLPLGASYEHTAHAGEAFIHTLIAYANSRGLDTAVQMNLTEYPRELEAVIPQATTLHQLGSLTVGPGPAVSPGDPDLLDVAGEVARQTVNTYPEADLFAVGMPEFRAWAGLYEEAWAKLDEKYGIADLVSLETVIARAHARTSYAGGAKRAVQEAKGDLVTLYFLDKLFVESEALAGSKHDSTPIAVVGVAEELFPIVARVLPDGWECNPYIDYTASHILQRPEVVGRADTSDTAWFLCYTLHDDNIGVLPQLATGSLHKLTEVLAEAGWSGFVTRYWMTSDHDPCVAYLSKAGWDVTEPEDVYRDQFRATCGDDAVEPMLAAFAELEDATLRLEKDEIGVAFPVPGMMSKHWEAKPMSDALVYARERYRAALAYVERTSEPSTEVGRSTVNYWRIRLQFGIDYLDVIDGVRQAATAHATHKAARERDDSPSSLHALDESLRLTEAAYETTVHTLNAFATIARNASDRGAVATMDEYLYRFLKAKIAALRAERKRLSS